MDSNTINRTGMVSGAYQRQLSVQPPKKQANVNSAPDVPFKGETGAVAVDTLQVRSTVTLKNLETVRTIEQMHARLNQQAKGVRETNESINKATEQVGQLKSGLQGILKNFPPFSVDSMERKELLMGYTSLRKELLQLMVPPPPPAVYEKVEQMWGTLFDKNGQILPSSVPPVESASSDAQLNEASQGLDRISAQLAEFSNEVTQALVHP